MEEHQISQLHPDLVISTKAAIDRMGTIASIAASNNSPSFMKQIQLVRKHAKSLCNQYRNCREHDWCWLCASGSNGKLFLGETCLQCKLIPVEVILQHKSKLVQIDTTESSEHNQS